MKCLAVLARGAPKTLRDFGPEEVDELMGILPESVRRRCLHVVEETARVAEAEDALITAGRARLREGRQQVPRLAAQPVRGLLPRDRLARQAGGRDRRRALLAPDGQGLRRLHGDRHGGLRPRGIPEEARGLRADLRLPTRDPRDEARRRAARRRLRAAPDEDTTHQRRRHRERRARGPREALSRSARASASSRRTASAPACRTRSRWAGRARSARWANERYSCSGTPADCVMLAMLGRHRLRAGDRGLRHQPRRQHRYRHRLLGHLRRGAAGGHQRHPGHRRLLRLPRGALPLRRRGLLRRSRTSEAARGALRRAMPSSTSTRRARTEIDLDWAWTFPTHSCRWAETAASRRPIRWF